MTNNSRNSLAKASVIAVLAVLLTAQTSNASGRNLQFYSTFASALNETCRTGFSSKSPDAREAKGYCMGFLYAVITKLEADGSACFGADISRPIEVAADLLERSPEHATSWDVLLNGYKKEFPCS